MKDNIEKFTCILVSELIFVTMLISRDIYAKFCPKYQKEIDKFEDEWKKVDGKVSKILAVYHFFKNVFIVKEIWKILFEVSKVFF